MSFDQFVRDVCEPDDLKPPHARIKTPSWAALSSARVIGVDRHFSYDVFDAFRFYVAEKTGKPIQEKTANVSPIMDLVLAPELEARLRLLMAFEFDLHGALS